MTTVQIDIATRRAMQLPSPQPPVVDDLIVVKANDGVSIAQGPQGAAGPPGPPAGADLHYTHTQGPAASVWVITHNLGKFPDITVFDSAGDECDGDVVHNSLSQVTVTFSAPFSGVAYLN